MSSMFAAAAARRRVVVAPALRWQTRYASAEAKKAFQETLEERSASVKHELAALAAAFMRYDGEGKGKMKLDNIKDALKDLELPSGEVDVHSLFKTLDVNKDGSIELKEWLDNLPPGARVKVVERFTGGENEATIMDQFLPDAHRHVRMTLPGSSIVYTYTDEAPALATFSFLPIIKAYCKPCGVNVKLSDISLAGRVIANFPDNLDELQRQPDELAELGVLAKTPAANIIKLPNVSASIPQLQACIAELQSHGYQVPDYPEDPANEKEQEIHDRYKAVLGSAVNPVLREGNSDRRVAPPVKEYAKNNPHKMGKWTKDSKTNVAHMTSGDFYENEKSAVCEKDCSVRIEHVNDKGEVTVLKPRTTLLAGEVIDSSVMNVKKLREFYASAIKKAKDDGVLLSLHLKATMMKVSDPIMFGHMVKVFFAPVFEKYGEDLAQCGADPNNGLGDVLRKIESLPDAKRQEIDAMIKQCMEDGPDLAMVDSDKGITNLHVPSDVIIDASMPAAIRDSGKMWCPGKDSHLQDTIMTIPDRCYATIYQEVLDYCKENGAFDPSKMGNVANVGLMAQKAEEYGSHNKTFEAAANGTIRVVDRDSEHVYFEQKVEEGDIFRMCQTKDLPIQDWVKLAVSRGRATGAPVVFWLTKERGHDRSLIEKVNTYLEQHDCKGLDIRIMAPEDAMRWTLQRCGNGEDTIAVTGNVLRDYLTDLFPILELGTSAKMLSIVPLLAGGGLFETGAGGSAPKHVQQFVKEGHLRWDSLGEFLALAVSLEDLAVKSSNPKAKILADALNGATGRLLDLNRSPLRKVGQPDNRASHFYIALYWAKELAEQQSDLHMAQTFGKISKQLERQRKTIVKELEEAQGMKMNIGGYYHMSHLKAEAAMRPSTAFNAIIDNI